MDPSEKPFVLIARIKVKEGKVEEYLDLAEKTDQAVEQSEPDMLLHNFDADPSDPHQFTWLNYIEMTRLSSIT